MTAFIADASSFQGNVNWDQVATVCRGGVEKVTQGTTYANPYWPQAKAAFQRLAAGGFAGAGYLFLEEGGGAAQAEFFARHAGDMAGLGVVVDAEPTAGSRPTRPTMAACVSELHKLFPGKPVGGYPPHWYWGDTTDLTLFDWLWASNYVTGTSSAADLYRHVTRDQWAGYGGMDVAVLQFTSTALVPGVAGPCDCSAYEGADLVALFTGGKQPGSAPGAVLQEEEAMWLPTDKRAVPVALPNGARRLRFVGLTAETLRLDWLTGASPDKPTGSLPVSYPGGAIGIPVPDGVEGVRVVRGDLPAGETVYPLVSMLVLT